MPVPSGSFGAIRGVQIVVVERVGLAKVAPGVEVVEPDFPWRRAVSKNNTTVLTPAPRNVPPGMSSTVCRLQFSNSPLRSVTLALSVFDKKSVLDDDAGATAGLERLQMHFPAPIHLPR